MYFKKTKTYLFIGIRESNSFNFQQSNEKMKKVREKMQKMCRLRAYCYCVCAEYACASFEPYGVVLDITVIYYNIIIRNFFF